MGSTKVRAPQRDYYGEMEATTLGQMALQPSLLAFRQATAPLYGQLDFKMARDMLLGQAGGQQVKNPEWLAKKAELDLYRKRKDYKGRPAADPAEIARLESELSGMEEFTTTEATRGCSTFTRRTSLQH